MQSVSFVWQLPTFFGSKNKTWAWAKLLLRYFLILHHLLIWGNCNHLKTLPLKIDQSLILRTVLLLTICFMIASLKWALFLEIYTLWFCHTISFFLFEWIKFADYFANVIFFLDDSCNSILWNILMIFNMTTSTNSASSFKNRWISISLRNEVVIMLLSDLS